MSVLEQVLEAMDASDRADSEELEFARRIAAGENVFEIAAELGRASMQRWCDAFGLDFDEVERACALHGGKVAAQSLAVNGRIPCFPHRALIEGMCGASALIGFRMGLLVADALSKRQAPDA